MPANEFLTGIHAVERKDATEAYGLTIRRELARHIGREVAVGAIYTALARLERRGLDATDERVDRVFAAAKAADGVLTEEEIRRLL